MTSDAPPGFSCPLCFVLGHLQRLFRSKFIFVVIDEAEESLRDDSHQVGMSSTVEDDGEPAPDRLAGSVTINEGNSQDPGNDLDEEETVSILTRVPDNPNNSSWRLGDVNTRPLVTATSRNLTRREILRSNDTSGPFCRPCTENSDHSIQNYREAISPLYCSGCRRIHSSSLFSAKQRQEGPNKRICIGREGHIRLCEHITFGLEEFVHTSSTTNGDTSITRNHPDHLGDSNKLVSLRARLGMSPHTAMTGTPNEAKATLEHTNNYASWGSVIGLDKRAHLKVPAYMLR